MSGLPVEITLKQLPLKDFPTEPQVALAFRLIFGATILGEIAYFKKLFMNNGNEEQRPFGRFRSIIQVKEATGNENLFVNQTQLKAAAAAAAVCKRDMLQRSAFKLDHPLMRLNLHFDNDYKDCDIQKINSIIMAGLCITFHNEKESFVHSSDMLL